MADVPALEGPQKKASPILLIAALAGLTVVGGGAGWLVGTMVAPAVKVAKEQQKAAEEKKGEGEGKSKDGKADEGLPKMPAEAAGIIQLDPVTTNLAYPSESWVRLEVALVFNGAVDTKLAEDIHQDLMAYMRTVSLQQIEGPRGFDYLKDDLKERVDVRSEGRVSKVLFRTFVIE
ncbi:flagellar basal body-associated FliL family protein [Allorhizobium taibaishanense]|uniref:Flagellar protein FliL n=1 Tax=Allorhizobium taibaishanense TaxID=887144 RepID=A0A1Q9ABT7_9HYPH|nr:flagellar basal body-associated FliL family protein [Allorhizobium taibaishanense]MBB4010224.1 flagellar FliL protein [Allorhizobium taibaishanense]OLP52341.1 flagellar basal body protein FliL [Allorhizobium taibaishanense]